MTLKRIMLIVMCTLLVAVLVTGGILASKISAFLKVPSNPGNPTSPTEATEPTEISTWPGEKIHSFPPQSRNSWILSKAVRLLPFLIDRFYRSYSHYDSKQGFAFLIVFFYNNPVTRNRK